MDLDLSQKIFNLLAARWQSSMEKQQYDDAVQVCMAAYLLFKVLEDDVHQQIPLTWLSVVEKLRASVRNQSTTTSQTARDLTCAFCLQSKPESELIAGVGALICRSCVANISQGLGSDGRKPRKT